MMNESGFYRVLIVHNGGQTYYRYQIRNKLLHKEITRKDIYKLKQAVEEKGLLWGITDLEKAEKNSGKYKLKVLQGKYGLKVD